MSFFNCDIEAIFGGNGEAKLKNFAEYIESKVIGSNLELNMPHVLNLKFFYPFAGIERFIVISVVVCKYPYLVLVLWLN